MVVSTKEFLVAWTKTGNVEKGYFDDPNGGPTMYGITQNVARAFGYAGDMRDLPPALALDIAKQRYWDSLLCDGIATISADVAYEIFDTGYLSGTAIAGIFLQRALNLFNRSSRIPPDYADVVEDGHVGALTIYALKQYFARRGADGEIVMLRCLNAQQGSYLMDLARNKVQDEDFEFGWYLNRVSIV